MQTSGAVSAVTVELSVMDVTGMRPWAKKNGSLVPPGSEGVVGVEIQLADASAADSCSIMKTFAYTLALIC